jgi:CDP-paratose 2-epimerase
MEDQGWVAHFVISSCLGKPVTIYGDGKQVRDVLYVDDLVDAYRAYAQQARRLGGQVFNLGGGPEHTLSLLELVGILEKQLGHKIDVSFSDWRPADQKVYVSDIRRAMQVLGWAPKVGPTDGVRRLLDWVKRESFAR